VSVVRIGLAKRAPGLSRRAAQAHWRGEHARLFARLPGLLSYVQNHAFLDDQGEPLLEDPGFDIFAEVEFDDEVALERVASSPYYREVILADEKNLLDASQRTFLMTHRRMVDGKPRAEFPKVALFTACGSREQITDRWLADIAACAPRALAVSANVVDRVGGSMPRPVDVVLQHYFRDLGEACEWYAEARLRWPGTQPGQTRIICGVIAMELEIVARRATDECAEVRP
jgi:hypothetical protein